jgi:DNA-binding NarL/FixJ family response regulator
VIDLEHLWPDPDRRDGAQARIARRMNGLHPFPERGRHCPVKLEPSATELRVLQAMSYGLGRQGAADVCGVSLNTVMTQLQSARAKLRAKNTTHACCEALRQGLIH